MQGKGAARAGDRRATSLGAIARGAFSCASAPRPTTTCGSACKQGRFAPTCTSGWHSRSDRPTAAQPSGRDSLADDAGPGSDNGGTLSSSGARRAVHAATVAGECARALAETQAAALRATAQGVRLITVDHLRPCAGGVSACSASPARAQARAQAARHRLASRERAEPKCRNVGKLSAGCGRCRPPAGGTVPCANRRCADGKRRQSVGGRPPVGAASHSCGGCWCSTRSTSIKSDRYSLDRPSRHSSVVGVPHREETPTPAPQLISCSRC